jgi:hypothetical protein
LQRSSVALWFWQVWWRFYRLPMPDVVVVEVCIEVAVTPTRADM